MPCHPANPGSSPGLSFIFFLLLQIAVQSAGQSVRNTGNPQCYSFHCGDGVEIRYPLWNSSEASSSYCGYPGLGIDCEGGYPVLKLGGDTYRVSDVRYNTSTITLHDKDLLDSECPRATHNLTLNEGVRLEKTEADDYLLFFFNCSGAQLPDEYKLPCLSRSGSSNDSYVFQEGSIRPESYPWGHCEDFVMSPVLTTEIPRSVKDLSSSFGTVLHQGFQLKWLQPNMADCISCEKAGRSCGYAQNKDVGGLDFLCFCNDGAHPRVCNGGTNKRNRKIAIGVGAGVGGFLLASALCLLLYRRKKMRARTGSSTLLFRTAPSEPSSQRDPEMGSSSTHYSTNLFEYDELSEATNGFSDANELGDGGFGTVYKGKLRDGRIVAVKRLYENNYKRVDQFKNEVGILNRLRHQNLVTLYGCTSRHSRELLLVYEYVPNGTVADHLHGHRASEGELTWPIRLNIAMETATALAYLHKVEPQIIHRDVKTNNILLDNGFHVKVADFGLSRLFPVDATHVSTAPQGTPGYVDPEYHQCYQLTDKSDVYSFGVVLVELISSKPAVDITRHRHEINLANMAINKIQNGALHELVDPALEFETDWVARRMIKLVAELAFRCLQAEKEMRPSMEDVVEVLQGIHDCQDEAERSGDMDHGAPDDTSLLKNNAPVSPDSVMDKWASRTTTPNTSA